ncbi:saccharopine dehydrogenase NADP-binding domain-containing protein [Pseudonocardia sp. CA-107938]|uniref:saccharopine dehydrogenase NADP-binding domain-containing protein n=1 Tax=Pseudonocardia sp. CA-107938 TaxID=3240021 RepID=UPI003D8F369E
MQRVVVYGAYGHTGQFVTAELLRRGLEPVLSGRDADRLAELGSRFPGLDQRPAAIDDPAALAAALDGAAVINTAGPFLDTAAPVATAAVRAGVHYLDVSAEQGAAAALHRELAADARAAGVAVVPAMAFFGGLADLLATAALDGRTTAEEITVAIALDRWWPTEGTRLTGRRNTATRLVVTDGRLAPLVAAPPTTWSFPTPFDEQEVVDLPFSEIITMASHLQATTIRSLFAATALRDLRDPDTPTPEAVDADGRSAQRFVVDVVARTADGERRVTASGQDIYAVTAPIVVEAVARILDGRASAVGVLAPGALLDAADVLHALGREHLTVAVSGAAMAGNRSPREGSDA